MSNYQHGPQRRLGGQPGAKRAPRVSAPQQPPPQANNEHSRALAESDGKSAGGPPDKSAPPTLDGALQLHRWLTDHIAGGPASTNPWTFYEVVDTYLGPWGEPGYPIGYGKKYCMVFSTDPVLAQDWRLRAWNGSTLVKLQEELRDYIVEAYRTGKLVNLCEGELRAAAFRSHPKAYTEGGLTNLVLDGEVGSLLHITSIPKAEYDPRSENFDATISQVIDTTLLVGGEIGEESGRAIFAQAATGLSYRENARRMDADRNRRKRGGPEYTCPSCKETTRDYFARLPVDFGVEWVCSSVCLHHMFQKPHQGA